MNDVSAKSEVYKALAALLEGSDIEPVLGCSVELEDGNEQPKVALLYVRFAEDIPNVPALARFLWAQAINCALPRRRRLDFIKRLTSGSGDVSEAAYLIKEAKRAFLEFKNQYPHRASEVGEVLAYCIALAKLKAAQLVAKLSLKTSGNMPVHGLDGIHARLNTGVFEMLFLEAKLSANANSGAKAYADSVSSFLNGDKQYLLEYTLASDLGNLDTLEGTQREALLRYLDVYSPPQDKRERSVGVICYSEKKCFAEKLPVSDDLPPDAHDKHFSAKYTSLTEHHRAALTKHLHSNGADPKKCWVFFVAVPDVDALRERFYEEMTGE